MALESAAFQFWGDPVIVGSDGRLSCPGFVGNDYADNAYDYALIGGIQTPGLIADLRVDASRDVDKKKAAGSDGARLTIHGVEPAKVELDILIWTPEQLRLLQSLWLTIKPRPSKGKPQAYYTHHPLLDFNSVSQLVVVDGNGPKLGSVARTRLFTVRFIEQLHPSKGNTTTTPVDAVGSVLDPGAESYLTPGSDPDNVYP